MLGYWKRFSLAVDRFGFQSSLSRVTRRGDPQNIALRGEGSLSRQISHDTRHLRQLDQLASLSFGSSRILSSSDEISYTLRMVHRAL